MNLPISFHKNQIKIFYESDARYKIVPKGRRFGLTRGYANYLIDYMLDGGKKALWVDTVNGNIDRYVERYFYPVLSGLPGDLWDYKQTKKELRIRDSYADFRSADQPERIEGFGYDLILVNEAGIVLKDDYLWHNSILPMTLDYKAKVIIGGTPKGKRVKGDNREHLFFHLYNKALDEKNTDWQAYHFTTFDNPLLDRKDIIELMNDLPPNVRDQEIYAKFVDDTSHSIFKREWWHYYEYPPAAPLFIADSWDTAFKTNEENDYSVRTTWAVTQNGFYLIDFWKGRVSFPELKRKVVSDYAKNNPNEVLIEDKASGISLIQELQSETFIPIKAVSVDADKVARANAVTTLIEAGKIFLPANASFTSELVDECATFPNGEHDDVVDSISQALNYLKQKVSGFVPELFTRSRQSLTNQFL